MKLLFVIGSGSFIGGVSRYLLSQLIHSKYTTHFPIGTLGVNILGCFVIGLVFGLSEKMNFAHEWQLFLITGILGGFTTFSAFSNETFSLIRDGQMWIALSYILLSVVVGILATFLGFSLLKLF
jgi:fluoride exporter